MYVSWCLLLRIQIPRLFFRQGELPAQCSFQVSIALAPLRRVPPTKWSEVMVLHRQSGFLPERFLELALHTAKARIWSIGSEFTFPKPPKNIQTACLKGAKGVLALWFFYPQAKKNTEKDCPLEEVVPYWHDAGGQGKFDVLPLVFLTSPAFFFSEDVWASFWSKSA